MFSSSSSKLHLAMLAALMCQGRVSLRESVTDIDIIIEQRELEPILPQPSLYRRYQTQAEIFFKHSDNILLRVVGNSSRFSPRRTQKPL
jgi:hypothetical protein